MTIAPEILKQLYRDMLRIRMVEEKIADVYAAQEMRCPVHLCIGQEAVAVGVCAQLETTDFVFSTHRAHGHYLAKGGSLLGLLGELYGRESGCCRGRGGSMHLIDQACGFLAAAPIVGSTIPIAVGAAFGGWQQGHSNVTVAFFGEGATEEGAFHEALNFAVLKQLPILFVCENNGYSVYSPMSVRRPEAVAIHQLAAAYGVPACRADGNDVVAVYKLTGQAVQRARSGGGPSFLEFTTSRWREHCGPNYDDDLGYRSPEEVNGLRDACPISNFRQQLIQNGFLTQTENDALTASLISEIERLHDQAHRSPYPESAPIPDQVYAP